MILTAEEQYEAKAYYNKWMNELLPYEKQLIIDLIKEAQVQTVEECAKYARTKWDQGHKHIQSAYVDKDSILKLIVQIK